MSIRKKIIGGFVIVFFIGLIIGIVGLISTSRLTGMSQEQYELQEAGDGVSGVLEAHYAWRQGLTEAVLTMSPFTGSLDPDTCALGKWKNSDEAKKVSDPEILSLLSQLDDPHDYIHTEAKLIVDLIEAGNREEATSILVNGILPRTEEAISILSAMTARYAVLLEQKGALNLSFGNLMTTLIITFAAAALIVSVLLAWRIITSIMKPLRKMAKAAGTISTGDLDVDVSYPVNDEIGKLAGAFQKMLDTTKEQVLVAESLADGDLTTVIAPRSEKDAMNIALQRMVDNLNGMFGEIQASTAQVSTGAKQIADGAQALAQGATEQAAAVEELSSSMNEIAVQTKENAGIANEAAELSGVIRSNAEKGSLQMDQMMLAVREINEASGQISKVIKVIDDIAFQTNILALNAAVEAARAGQHGKGFAVVAEEVRNLAAKSAEAAKDTGGLIENSIEKANLGLDIATETAESLREIVDGINHSAEIVLQIAQSSEQQSMAIEQINTGIDQVAQVVQQNSATAEESAAASEEMSGQSDTLEQLISQLKLKDADSRPALSTGYGPDGKVFAMPEKTPESLTGDNGGFGKY